MAALKVLGLDFSQRALPISNFLLSVTNESSALLCRRKRRGLLSGELELAATCIGSLEVGGAAKGYCAKEAVRVKSAWGIFSGMSFAPFGDTLTGPVAALNQKVFGAQGVISSQRDVHTFVAAASQSFQRIHAGRVTCARSSLSSSIREVIPFWKKYHCTLAQPANSSKASERAVQEMGPSKFTPLIATADELPSVIPFTFDLSQRNKGPVDQLQVRYTGEASEDPESTASTSEREPEESWIEIRYPFTRSPSLREQYRLFGTAYVRFGKILEDMDAMAGDVVWRHLRRKDRLIATAAVDHLAWAGDLIRLDKDFRLQGQVTWVGRSSMEITLEASTIGPGPEDSPEVLGSAHFVMVSREGERAASVPQLVLETARSKELFEAGAEHAERRRKDREDSLYKKAPTGDELALLHNLFIESQVATMPGQEWSGTSAEEPTGVGATGRDGWTFMESTKMQSVHLMHSQQRNANGFMFGGFVMREAYELGWICARLHTRLTPVISSVDDVAFMKPVPVGSLIRFTAQVIYVEGSLLRVLVQADELGPAAPHGGAERIHTTTNFHFAFRMVDRKMGSGALGPFAAASAESPTSAGGHALQFPPAQQIVRKVMPKTYAEGMRYLEGYRWHTWEAQLEPPSREPLLGVED